MDVLHLQSLALPLALGLASAAAITLSPPGAAARLAALAAVICLAAYLGMAGGIAAGQPLATPFWHIPSLGVAGGLRLDGLSLIFALLITGIGALVLLYAGRYLEGDPRLSRLVVLLLLFMTAMLGSVTADDVITRTPPETWTPPETR